MRVWNRQPQGPPSLIKQKFRTAKPENFTTSPRSLFPRLSIPAASLHDLVQKKKNTKSRENSQRSAGSHTQSAPRHFPVITDSRGIAACAFVCTALQFYAASHFSPKHRSPPMAFTSSRRRGWGARSSVEFRRWRFQSCWGHATIGAVEIIIVQNYIAPRGCGEKKNYTAGRGAHEE